MGILKELREAAPLARALREAVDGAAVGLQAAADAAALIQVPPQPGALSSARDAASAAPAVSSGPGGGGGGGGRIAPPQQVRAVNRQLQPRSVDWLNQCCTRRTFKIPNPRNRNAVAQNDMVTIGGWDCSGELGVQADFYDPDDMARLLGTNVTLSSKSSGGGGYSGPDPRYVIPPTVQAFGGSDGIVEGMSGSSTVGPPGRPAGPVSVTDPAMAEQTRLLREIRDQGRQDNGLGRRVGGRP